ncbi:MAG: methyl-accepting chemotaxis protein [Desulfobacteraceae bacterium]|nr:methyl-accepting chemotaxis protein [Desulfobacteraceae bacterium]
MKWFLNLSTRKKLMLGFGLMVLFLLAIMALGYGGIERIQSSQQQIYDRYFAYAMALKDVRADEYAVREDLLAVSLARDPASQDLRFRDIQERSRQITQSLAFLRKGLSNYPDLSPQLQQFNAVRTEFVSVRDRQIVPLLKAGKVQEAQRLTLGEQQQRNERLDALSADLIDGVEGLIKGNIRASEQQIAELLAFFAAIGLLALAAAAFMISLMNRAIAGPLGRLAGIAEAISVGSLEATVREGERRDEVGDLAQSFSRMILYLRGMAEVAERIAAGDISVQPKPLSERDTLGQAVARMAESLRQMTREIQESVSVLASAASEIMSSTSEVASSVSETATAVNQTTSTLEEVKQTTMVSDDKAQYVSQTAQRAAQVSLDGSNAVEETIEKMDAIREQMEAIAGSIMKLSDQSQAIGEIIATVNDLAEQSNLLAVNAAIEAAKAGEHGKGFAVVAQEVKSLAEQSKAATAQVRTILNDIQKATGAAVLAAEQGSKSVEAGVKQSEQAGESIKTLGASIAEAAQAAAQITASSRQQLTGVEQIITAMDNIRQASEQNVAGTRQSETAAHGLHDLGQKLKQLVGRYRV